jgi:hypothetical protein
LTGRQVSGTTRAAPRVNVSLVVDGEITTSIPSVWKKARHIGA